VRYDDIAAFNRLVVTIRSRILACRIGVRTVDFEDDVFVLVLVLDLDPEFIDRILVTALIFVILDIDQKGMVD
jgi:hypothetical protein